MNATSGTCAKGCLRVQDMQMLLEGYLPGPSEEFKSSIAGDEFEVADMVLEGGPWKTISGFCRRAAEERSTGM